MRQRDTVELLLIAATTGVVALASPRLPTSLPAGEIALAASGILLGQGLIRDLWIKFSLRRRPAPSCSLTPGRKGACMCMESTLGIFGILAGITALLGGMSRTVTLPSFFWPALVLTVMIAGFLLKSLVIDWKARRIRIEHHHEDVLF